MSLRASYRRLRWGGLAATASATVLIACSSIPPSPSPSESGRAVKTPSAPLPALPPAKSGRGGYYMDDGPGDAPPEGLLDTPDAEPRIEPYSTRSNRPYEVFGKKYAPFTDERSFKQRGIGSWYGRKFHGQKTSSGEIYDMYKMTAAHPTLPIPSYARVTNLDNGKQVIVRVNDRGPFHSSRIIDLSYTAALKLGYLARGSGRLEVERLLPAEIERMAGTRQQQTADAAPQESAAPLPATAAAPVTGVSATGYYLQLGAYSQAASAESARARLSESATGMLAPLEVVEQGALYRLYSGPFGNQQEAAAAAKRLRERGSFKPLIVQR